MQSENEAISVYTHNEKATLLAERFFPVLPANFSDIQDYIFINKMSQQKFKIKRTVCTKDIQKILKNTSA
jgi:hypothetical protein